MQDSVIHVCVDLKTKHLQQILEGDSARCGAFCQSVSQQAHMRSMGIISMTGRHNRPPMLDTDEKRKTYPRLSSQHFHFPPIS